MRWISRNPDPVARGLAGLLLLLAILAVAASNLSAQEAGPAPTTPPAAGAAHGPGAVAVPADAENAMSLRQLLRAGGAIGLVILAMSVSMVALIVEHLLTIRRRAMIPTELAEAVPVLIAAGRFAEAEQLCQDQPSFLGQVLAVGLVEVPYGYKAVEKAIEDASAGRSARLFRKIEYLWLIASLAPMLGLLGTVWGMIIAFQEFAAKANPPVSELAPGIFQALVTTAMGLAVAVPALAGFAIFRNRIDELVAEAVLCAEGVFADFKRASIGRTGAKAGSPGAAGARRRVRAAPATEERTEETSP